MSAKPVRALTDSAARQIVAAECGDATRIAVLLADEILARGGWKANTCAPLARAYEMARDRRRPVLNPLAVLQRAARRAEGERDTAELLGHCDRCQRPMPHTDAERRVCPGPTDDFGGAAS